MSIPTDVLKAKKPLVASHTNKLIYLDNHATTPLDPRVLETMLPYLSDNFGNAASGHIFGVRASYAVEQARAKVANAVNSEAEEIIFTSGATESNNFVLKGVFEHYFKKKPHFIVSSIEHKCILEAAKHIKKQGGDITFLSVNSDGLVEPSELKKAIKPNTVLVSLMLANNEIGSINPIAELAAICHQSGVLFHTDAAQAIGKIPVDVKELGIDMLSASGHKFYGPKGVGFVYVANSAKKFLTPLLDGGGQESHLRSGTLNVPGIVGLGKAIDLAVSEIESDFWQSLELRNQLYDRLKAGISGLKLNGPEIVTVSSLKKLGDFKKITQSLNRLPNNLNLTLPASTQGSRLAPKLTSVAFSAGSACSAATQEPSHVLMTIGRTSNEAQDSLRFGIGRFNTPNEIQETADLFIRTINSN